MKPRRSTSGAVRTQGASAVDALVFQCKAAGLPEPEREVRFHATRKWRFDLAWWDVYFFSGKRCLWIAVEVDGGVYVQGRHARGKGLEADMEKIATSMTMGWRVLRVTPRHVRTGQALRWIEALLKG
jgi:hypothetical protein